MNQAFGEDGEDGCSNKGSEEAQTSTTNHLFQIIGAMAGRLNLWMEKEMKAFEKRGFGSTQNRLNG